MSTSPKNTSETGAPFVRSLTGQQQKDIGELLGRWHSVQGRLKKAEQISQIAVIPAINELRYAGRMLVAAMSNTQPAADNGLPDIDKAIVVAGQYITNAEHDIADALVYFYQKKADDLNARFGAKTIEKEFPKYRDLLDLLKRARNLVIISRADISKRKENYKNLVGVVEQLNDMYFLFVDADVLFSLEVDHYRAEIKLWKSVTILTVIVVISIFGYVIF